MLSTTCFAQSKYSWRRESDHLTGGLSATSLKFAILSASFTARAFGLR
jgi:hypothetical protein